jgi:SAM-dependent methyltransferase
MKRAPACLHRIQPILLALILALLTQHTESGQTKASPTSPSAKTQAAAKAPSKAASASYLTTAIIGDPWSPEYLLPYYSNVSGPNIFDAKKRALYCRAGFFAGNTLRLWNEAVGLKRDLLAAIALEKGQRVLLVAKYPRESGLAAVVESLIGPAGQLITQDITQKAIDAIQTTPKARLQWPFSSFDSLAADSFDRVILFSAASHIENWESSARQITRILKDGGRIIVAEDPLGGREFITAVHADAHGEAHTLRFLAGMGLRETDLPMVGTEQMAQFFQSLKWSKSSSALGLYVFYGQKGGQGGDLQQPVPGNEAVTAFLAEKPFANPFDWMTPAETAAWGMAWDNRQEIRDELSYALFLGGGLHLISDLNRDISNIVYDNIAIKPHAKVLVISEALDEMKVLQRLKERRGAIDFEIYNYDICSRVRSASRRGESASWGLDYSYADYYPDRFFDVIWIAQAFPHAKEWNQLAARLLRVLKPGGQFIAQEFYIKGPDFYSKAYNVSGLFRCLMEKEYLRGGVTRMLPEPLNMDLVFRTAFGDSITDIHSIEKKGCATFWAFKKPYAMGDWWHTYPFLQKPVPR